MFKHAIRWGYLTDDPARFAEKPREAKKEMEYLTPDEVRRFLEAANPEFYPLFATAVLTGARQGEILALRRSDVDLKRRVMFIHRSYHPQYGFSEPKTKSGTRAIVISGELTMILDEYMEKNDRQPGDLVFQNKAGNPVDPQNMMTREFHPALERAGVKPIRFHDLRHTYAALIIALGENIKFIQRQLGHASLTTTMDTYGHLLPEVSEGFGDRLDSLLFQNNVVYFLKKRPEGTKKRPIAGSNG
jgi:integrase